LAESRTFNSTDKLYYLEQFTAGDVKELLRRKYSDDYRIVSAYEMKALNRPSIKAEGGLALNRVSVFPASCKNALTGSQYISKFDQQGDIQKLVFKIPYSMSERWRRAWLAIIWWQDIQFQKMSV